MRRHILLFYLLFCRAGEGLAQESIPKYIEPFVPYKVSRPETGGARRIVEWRDSLSGRLLKRIDLLDLNPYRHLKGKIVSKDDDFDTPVIEFSPGQAETTGLQLVSPRYSCNVKDKTPHRLLTRYLTSQKGKYLAVVYELITFNKSRENISTHSTILIFDAKGNNIKTLKHWDINCYDQLVSNDGRFFLYKLGGPDGWDRGGGYIPEGLEVYDLNRDSIIYKSPVNISTVPNLGGDSFFFINNNNSYTYHEYNIFDFGNGIVYQKRFYLDQPNGGLRAIEPYGFRMWDPVSRKEYILYYEKDFLKKKIWEK